jgi:hypothetical protein
LTCDLAQRCTPSETESAAVLVLGLARLAITCISLSGDEDQGDEMDGSGRRQRITLAQSAPTALRDRFGPAVRCCELRR